MQTNQILTNIKWNKKMICNKCKQEREVKSFYSDKINNGVMQPCRSCRAKEPANKELSIVDIFENQECYITSDEVHFSENEVAILMTCFGFFDLEETLRTLSINKEDFVNIRQNLWKRLFKSELTIKRVVKNEK